MISVDYDFYKNNYYGDVLSESEFSKFIKRSEPYVSQITFRRADSIDEDDVNADKIKYSLCAVAELVKSYTNEDGSVHGAIASESVGGSWSISYNNNSDNSNNSLESAIYSKLQLYLAGTGLLYAGAFI